MATMVRKQIYIEPEQEERLKQLASRTKMSEAQIIRQALERGLEAPEFLYPNDAAWEAEVEFMRSLAAKGPVEGGRRWRREDLYDD